MRISPLIVVFTFCCSVVYGQVAITEFLASNATGLEDEDGDDEDWIELTNFGGTTVDLDGWSLTDDLLNTQKWIFPAVSMAPGEVLVVFASSKDRSIPGLPLHTNFKLSKGGEYLGLYEPGGAIVATEFAPEYPPQATDVSYGSQFGVTEETPVDLGTPGRAGVPTSQSNFNSQFGNWNTSLTGSFTGSSWQAVNLGVGYETTSGYGGWLGAGGDLETEMYGNNASVFVRVPFTVTDAGEITSAALKMRWDDGFIAYLNGVQIGEDREPGSPAWNSSAMGNRNDALNEDQTQFNINLGSAPLNEGDNLLAIHGLNANTTSSDMLIQPELVLTRSSGAGGTLAYFPTPTPGSGNGVGQQDLAPLFEAVTEFAAVQPTGTVASPPLLLTADVREGTDPIDEVKVYYRTMFGPETSVTLFDDGLPPDAIAGDGIYSNEIPTHQVAYGEMLRWRFEVTDTNSGVRTSPPFIDPLDSDQYWGTVAFDNDLSRTDLPVLHTFVENPSLVDTVGGDRISAYYLGEFYDNIQMDRHGQSTAAFPKKSYDVDFNKGNRFKWLEGEGKVKDINLLTNWADKSKVRNTLAYEVFKKCDSSYHFAFPVRMERNGDFFSVTDLVEDGDDRFLERIGLDGEGALYKMYDQMVDVNAAGKKTRQEEDRQDLQDFYDNMDDGLSTTQRRRNFYDHADVASWINLLVSDQLIGHSDTGHKNYYLYRDTNGTREWEPLHWDVDLTSGRRWNSTDKYFDDNLHNFYSLWNSNPVRDLVNNTTEYRKMFVRRFETLRREIFQEEFPAPATDWYRNKVIEIELSINPPGTSDSDLDYTAWGSWGNMNRSLAASQRIYNDWLPAQRSMLFGTTNLLSTSVPSQQPSVPNVEIQSVDYNPVSGTQEEEYVIIKNNESTTLDLSGWTLSGAVEFTFPGGTVILDGAGTSGSDYQGLIHVAKSPYDFRQRSTGPTGGEFRYVIGPYSKQLSARGETVVLKNAEGTIVDQFTYAGSPTLGQQYLRITEINYNPAGPTAGELAVQPGLDDRDFEYLELMNIGPSTLDLSGAKFTEGIDYTFPGSTMLGTGARLVLAKNPTAFALRYGTPPVPVLGPYSGLLDNGGESLKLEDVVGENILSFTYSDYWYPESDGAGKSLVLRDTTAAFDAYDDAGTWGSSLDADGSPGVSGSGYRTHFNGWQASNYVETDHVVGMPGHPDSDLDGDGLTLWDEYALGTDENVPNDFVGTAGSVGSGASEKFGVEVTRRRFAADVLWELLSGSGVTGLSPVVSPVEANQTVVSPTQESVLIHDPDPMDGETEQFYQVRISPIVLP